MFSGNQKLHLFKPDTRDSKIGLEKNTLQLRCKCDSKTTQIQQLPTLEGRGSKSTSSSPAVARYRETCNQQNFHLCFGNEILKLEWLPLALLENRRSSLCKGEELQLNVGVMASFTSKFRQTTCYIQLSQNHYQMAMF